jgi:hypothetical protein
MKKDETQDHGVSRGDRKNVFCVLWKTRKERERLQDLGINKKLQLIKQQAGRAWVGLIWLRIGTSGGLLWTR